MESIAFSRSAPDNPPVAHSTNDWRTQALSTFPQLHELRDQGFSIYGLFSELDDMVRTAHREGNEDMLRRIYGYASWARVQADDDVQNAAGVSFYEHLFDERWMWPLVIPWINSTIVRDYMELWEFRLSASDLEEVRQLLYRGRLIHLKGQSRKR